MKLADQLNAIRNHEKSVFLPLSQQQKYALIAGLSKLVLPLPMSC